MHRQPRRRSLRLRGSRSRRPGHTRSPQGARVRVFQGRRRGPPSTLSSSNSQTTKNQPNSHNDWTEERGPVGRRATVFGASRLGSGRTDGSAGILSPPGYTTGSRDIQRGATSGDQIRIVNEWLLQTMRADSPALDCLSSAFCYLLSRLATMLMVIATITTPNTNERSAWRSAVLLIGLLTMSVSET